MLGKSVQPETPGLFVNAAFRRITVLVQGFQIAEHACEFVSNNVEFFGIHDGRPLQKDMQVLRVGGGDFRISGVA
jgi:hypothetical protein